MFGFLKKKLKGAIDTISGKAKTQVIEAKASEEEIKQAIAQEQQKKVQKATVIEDTERAKNHREKEKIEAKEKKPVAKKEESISKESKKAVEEKKSLPKKEEPIVVEPFPTPEVVEEAQEEVIAKKEEPVVAESVPEKKNLFKRFLGKKETPLVKETPVEKSEQEVQEEVVAEKTPVEEIVAEESEGLFNKLKDSFTKKQLTVEKFDELFWDLEMTLLENNVAVEVIEKIKADMKKDLTTGKVTRKGIEQLISDSLKESIESLFIEPYDLVQKVKDAKKPYIISFIGVNGAGKTTTLAKIANLFQENNLSVVMAASDTFRAAAIDQLAEHANNLGIKLISQGYGADPAAVAFDAIEHAKAKSVDVVMIDTAGRLHSNTNLMAELEKVIRVAKPDLKIFIGECTTGNDCVEQAEKFDELVGIDAIILSKADVDEKGGAAISVSHVTGHPILYLGIGQAYGDLQPFDKNRIVKNLGL